MMTGMMDRFFADVTPDDKRKMMMETMPKQERAEFATRLIDALMERGEAGMSEEEKRGFALTALDHVERHSVSVVAH